MFTICIYKHNTHLNVYTYMYICVYMHICICIYAYIIFFKKLAIRRGDMTCIFQLERNGYVMENLKNEKNFGISLDTGEPLLV